MKHDEVYKLYGKDNHLLHTSNAIIEDTRLTTEEYGCLMLMLHLKHDRGNQAAGIHALYKLHDEYEFKDITGWYLTNVLHIADVKDYEKLKGRIIRIISESVSNSGIIAIGHVINDEWFYFEHDIKERIEICNLPTKE